MQHSQAQINEIKTLFARMKFCFILLMFVFVAIYIYADRYQFNTTHNYWLGIIISVSVCLSFGYLFYMTKLVKNLDGNSIVWVLSTVILGPFGLLMSYIIISGRVIRLQRQQAIEIKQWQDKEE